MTYDYIVLGRGLIGAAAARHLSKAGYLTALVGPDEPQDRQQHQGVFASHYDEGRITRILDPHLHWAQLAQRSIACYRSLEAQTSITFYQEVGHLAVGQPADLRWIKKKKYWLWTVVNTKAPGIG
ncbi:MAG: FAD-binding oxidoreductase, partial [Leptolyngbya sp. SIO4C1]|nr:FAD-binding oxidoreductase [Leptolyngbya sp. SIO4C1]